jgi:NAD(P)H-nitrite reductase large subunit
MTSQSHPTINTPALKQFAIGKLTREQLLAYPPGTERLQRIHVVNALVEEIRAQESYIRLAGGQGFGYTTLLLATGSCPTGLPEDLPGQDFDGVLTLHNLHDYLDLRRRLNEVEEAVVIGGGSHAIETVMGLLYWGIRVHWLIRSETFLPRMLDRHASDIVLDGVRHAGAKVYTETEVVGVVGRVGVVAGVVTTGQQMLPCQLVLVCTGTSPVAALARHCDTPMKHQRGILVDDHLRTSVRNIYAAGDVAALRDPISGDYAPRAQWYAAVQQGRVAAATMTGSAEPEHLGVSWHATRLGDLSMLTVGNPLAMPDETTPLTERRKGSYRRLSLIDDRLIGYLSLGTASPDGLAIKRIIDEGLSVREITRDLLRGEFDARKYFSGKRSYAVQKMLTTGQLPTPLPAVPGIIAGERVATSRVPRRTPSSSSSASLQRTGEVRQPSADLPLVRPIRSGSRPTAGPPTTFADTDEQRTQLAAQPTLVGEDSGFASAVPASQPQENEAELAARMPERQFIASPVRRRETKAGALPNPHPSRSLWHYTNKHPAVKGKGNAQK